MEEESRRLTYVCDDVPELPLLPGEFVDDEVTTYIPQLLPNTLPPWVLPQECPSHNQAGPFPAQTDPFPAQPDPFHAQADPFHAQPDPYHAQPDPFHAQPDPFHAQPDPFHAQPDSFLTQPEPCLAQSGPFLTHAGPSHTQGGHLNTHNVLEYPFNQDFCILDRYMDSTALFSDLGLSFVDDDMLFPEIENPIDVTTPLSDLGTSDAQSDKERSPSLTPSGNFLSQAGPSQTQIGPNQTQKGPSHTNDNFKLKSMGQHKQDPTFLECTLCKIYFKREDKLQRHMEYKHFGRKPEYKCSKCGREFFEPSSLTRHSKYYCRSLKELSLPTDDEPATVNAYRKTYEEGPSHSQASSPLTQLETSSTQTGPSYLQASPSQTQTGPSKNKLMILEATKCPFCENVFSPRRSLERHMRSEHGCLTFLECSHCRKRFLTKNDLQEHIKTQHYKKKPVALDYECSKCGKKFSTSYNVNRHRKLHCRSVVKRPVSTGECESTLVDVDTHEAVAQTQPDVVEPSPSTAPTELPSDLDNDFKSYACPNCGRKFVLKRSLMEHQRLKCGIPPKFSCSQCSFITNYKSNLNRHMLSVHGSVHPQ